MKPTRIPSAQTRGKLGKTHESVGEKLLPWGFDRKDELPNGQESHQKKVGKHRQKKVEGIQVNRKATNVSKGTERKRLGMGRGP